ncbi:MAG: adenylosuccinate synthase [Schleiferiaceae bacterium]|jgi:adenylosuccinate synthase|nr:adenylosuccinate synthase [Schleiferiaceae bacterium]
MAADVLLGLQWGDEGKGKIVDVLTKQYDIIARFQGGPNAGHTLEFDGIKHVLHTIPSGIFHKEVTNLIGNGVVIDPIIFKKEIEALLKYDENITERLLISRKAHLILPTHRILDAASEASKGKKKIGSTLKGIGPTYMDKTGRNGLRIGDTELPSYKQSYEALVEKHKALLSLYDFDYNLEEMEQEWFDAVEYIKSFQLVDSEVWIAEQMAAGKKILAEGAQGTLLDVDFGTYPFVTSSNTTSAGACTGLGIAPNKMDDVFGIFKAYVTRVGSGPFPTELFDKDGEELQKNGNEFGATTGRPRRCGWLDIPALKYAIHVNGVTKLMMMKADVLSGFETLKVCTSYKYRGDVISHLPFKIESDLLEPIYEEVPGWQKDLTGCTEETEFPENLNNYIKYIEDKVGVPITLVSVGPDRKQTILR